MFNSIHRRAKAAIHERTGAENKEEAEKAVKAFASEFGVKWPNAVAKIASEKEVLLAFSGESYGSCHQPQSARLVD